MNIQPTRLYPVLLAVAGALIIGACGTSSSGGSTHTTTTASAASSTRTKLVACLKQHGVTLPNHRPGGRRNGGGRSGGGFFFGGGGGRFGGGNSKFAQAFKACGGKFGAGRFRAGGGRGFRPHFTSAILTKFASCVDRHGYKLPTPNTSGNGPIFPRSIESNKKFQAAAKSCASLLRPSAPPAHSTSTTSTAAKGH